MNILGIETSCDECAVAVVRNGKEILSNIVASQVERHEPWNGVVPEIASRLHVEWVDHVCSQALEEANVSLSDGIGGVAVTSRPGLIGSLLVGLSYAKGLAWSAGLPCAAVDHVLAHLYAPRLEYEIDFPYLGVIVSGGHTIICRVDSIHEIGILGTTIDDACGEAFDKVAKYYDMGYPGGVALDILAERGDCQAYAFPSAHLKHARHRYDLSFSGLKTAAINQLEQFRISDETNCKEDIAASFRKAAIAMLVSKIDLAVQDTGIHRVAAGGGVSANRLFRRVLSEKYETYFSSLKLCTDNGAMIAGLGYHHIVNGRLSGLDINASARISDYRHLHLGR